MKDAKLKRMDTVVRQRQIVDATQRLIVKYGSEHITIKRIAKEIGITEPAIYRHFKNKKDILMFIAENVEENLIGDIEKACREAFGKSLDTLHDILRRHISRISQRKGVSFLVIAEVISYGDRKLNKKVLNIINKYICRIQDILSVCIQNGEIKADVDIEKTAILFFSILQGVVHIWALDNFKSDLEKQVEPLWDLYRDSIQVT